jgi:imidazoleglycerol-phosphate dehydratase
MARTCRIERKTSETQVKVELNLDGRGIADIKTGIGFLDHMLTLFSVHGQFDLDVQAKRRPGGGFHHTVEDVGWFWARPSPLPWTIGSGIRRYGFAVTPMDDALAEVAIDLSNRPFLVYHLPTVLESQGSL